MKLPKQPLNVTRNICLSRIKDFTRISNVFFVWQIVKCALKWPLKALSEGQNQDGHPRAKILIELNSKLYFCESLM